ncbi:microtubule associated-domain-containing protein [Armillaria mellea]|nr:microtubule associated-domain-containing protein [Armillaria mellea]
MSTEKVDISTGSQPDISLGSLDSSFSPPHTSHANPLATPVVQRRNVGASSYLDDTDGDFLDTPERRDDTPAALRARRRSGAKGALTLRDQEKHIDHLKKENFDIKIKCHFLEERLAQLAPDQMDAALKQNIDLKIELSARGQEIKRPEEAPA